jgi:uncharacterized protein
MVNHTVGEGPIAKQAQGVHVVAKPTGPLCNLDCEYCFYLEKQALYRTENNTETSFRMSDRVLKTFIANYISSQPTPVVEFVWQGGEPTLPGIDFYRRVVELQRPFAAQKAISNALQTNGTLLTDDWCRFLKDHNFMVGISLDGPKDIHDRYRRDKSGKGSFDSVMHGLRLLQKHGVEYNVLVSVARETAHHPLAVYQYLRKVGVEYIQFTPIIERTGSSLQHEGLSLAAPPSLLKDESGKVTPWSVDPEEYGDFLIAVFEEWVRNDVGTVFVMNFEWALNAWLGNPSPVCVHAEQCGGSLVVEHNGDVYACDHCVYPEYLLGNVFFRSLPSLVEKSRQSGFGLSKETALPLQCRECEVIAACMGGCPKHRFVQTFGNESGLHYLCPGYRKFFRHIRKYLRAMTQLLENGLPVSLVMDAVKGLLVVKKQ